MIALLAIAYIRCKRKRLESHKRNNNRRIWVKKYLDERKRVNTRTYTRNLDLAIGKTTFGISECRKNASIIC